MYGTRRATGYGYSLWEFQVVRRPPAAHRHRADRRSRPQFKPVDRVVLLGGRQRAGGRPRRPDHHPLVQPVQRSTVDTGGPRRHRHDHRRGAELGGRVRARGYRIEVSADGSDVDHHLLHHHRHGRRARASTITGTGPLRADVRHGPGHRIRLLAVGVPGVRHGRHLATTPPMLSGPTRPPATTGQFALSAPADGAMVTTTRRPALSWAAVSRRGALPGLDQHQPHRLRLHRRPATCSTSTPRSPSRPAPATRRPGTCPTAGPTSGTSSR